MRISKIGTNEFLKLDDLNGEREQLIELKRRQNPSPDIPIVFTQQEIEQLNQTDIFYILQRFFGRVGRPTIFSENKKTISFERPLAEGREIIGIVKSGEYGVGADFFNVDDGNFIPNARTVNDSEIYPFFFHFNLPENSREGKLILQMFGVYGVLTVLQRDINNFLEQYNYSISFNRIVSHDFLNEMNSSRLVEVRLIKRSVPRDIADQIHNGVSQDLIEERVFKVHRKKNINPTDYLRQLLSNRDIDQYEILNERYSEVKAILTQSGSRRTITFGGADAHLGEELILPRDIPLQYGHPVFTILLSNSREYLAILNNTGDAARGN